jgi:hypothetical protein
MENRSYLARSWKALMLNRGWWKTIAILMLVELIPIIGPIVVMGYCFRWAREAAWGIEDPIPSKMGDLGAVIKSGAIVFLVMLVWGIIISAAYSALSIIPFVGGIFAGLGIFAAIVVVMVVFVMALRAVVYDKVGPGFQIAQAWEMCRNEPGGLFRILGMYLLFGLINLVIACSVFAIMMVGLVYSSAFMPRSSFSYGPNSTGVALTHQTSALTTIVPAVVVILIIVVLAVMFIQMMGYALCSRALGYWMAQFEPAKWGGSRAGVPAGVGPQRVAERKQQKQARQQGPQQAAQQQYAQQQAAQQQYAQQQYAQQQYSQQQYAQPQPYAQQTPQQQPMTQQPQPQQPPVSDPSQVPTATQAPAQGAAIPMPPVQGTSMDAATGDFAVSTPAVSSAEDSPDDRYVRGQGFSSATDTERDGTQDDDGRGKD